DGRDLADEPLPQEHRPSIATGQERAGEGRLWIRGRGLTSAECGRSRTRAAGPDGDGRAGRPSGVGRAVALPRGDLAERPAVLPALPERPLRVAEGQHRQNVVRVREADVLPNSLETPEAGPVRADAVGPRGEDHRLDRAAGVRHGGPAGALRGD